MNIKGIFISVAISAVCINSGLANEQSSTSDLVAKPFQRETRTDARRAADRLQQKAHTLPPNRLHSIEKKLLALKNREQRDSVCRQLIRKADPQVLPVLVKKYTEVQNVEARRDMVGLMGEINQGKYFRDVLIFLEGEALSQNEIIATTAIHAIAGIVTPVRGDKKKYKGKESEEVKAAHALLVRLANVREEPPYPQVQKVAARRLYRGGESKHIPKKLKEKWKQDNWSH